MRRRKITGLIMAVLFVAVTGILFSDARPGKAPEKSFDAVETAETETETEVIAETEAVQIFVYVCGAVEHPDVYALPSGARANEAIEAAGGMTQEAEPSALNLAKVLGDGEKLYVPSAGEAGEGNMPADDGRVDLNTADAAALQTLPGIGQAKAAAIIAYREKEGPFADIEDLLKVPGIKEGTFSGLKDLVKIN